MPFDKSPLLFPRLVLAEHVISMVEEADTITQGIVTDIRYDLYLGRTTMSGVTALNDAVQTQVIPAVQCLENRTFTDVSKPLVDL